MGVTHLVFHDTISVSPLRHWTLKAVFPKVKRCKTRIAPSGLFLTFGTPVLLRFLGGSHLVECFGPMQTRRSSILRIETVDVPRVGVSEGLSATMRALRVGTCVGRERVLIGVEMLHSARVIGPGGTLSALVAKPPSAMGSLYGTFRDR
jgi:hypothetical protein